MRCNNRFEPRAPWQVACSPECAELLAKAKREKVDNERAKVTKRELKDAKLAQRPIGYFRERAQRSINAYRRELTRHLGCMSCGTKNGKMNGGHYKSVGSSPETRFIEINIWCQCERCNSHLSGNLINYRANLLKHIGQERLDWLEGSHEMPHYKIPDLQEIEQKYLKLARELKQNS